MACIPVDSSVMKRLSFWESTIRGSNRFDMVMAISYCEAPPPSLETGLDFRGQQVYDVFVVEAEKTV